MKDESTQRDCGTHEICRANLGDFWLKATLFSERTSFQRCEESDMVLHCTLA